MPTSPPATPRPWNISWDVELSGVAGLKRINADSEVSVVGANGKVVLNRNMKLDRVVPLATYQQIAQQGLSVHLDIDTPPGQNQLRLAVRDNHTGYVGTLQAALGQ